MGSKISSKGQVTVPKKVRDAMGLKAGDSVDFVVSDGQTLLRPVKKWTVADMAGSLKEYAKSKPVPKAVYRKKIGEMLKKLDDRTKGH